MPTTFSRTLRSLDADAPSRRRGVLLAAAVLLAGGCWLAFGRVTVYELSGSARVEVRHAAHTVAAAVGGKVRNTYLTLGRQVAAGEVLVELDAEAERLALAERRARLAALTTRRQALRQEIEAEQQALGAQEKARASALAEARARHAEAAAQARYADVNAQTVARLRRTNAASNLEYQKAKSEAEAARAAEQALAATALRLDQDRLAQQSERRARLAKLAREQVELEGEAAVAEAAIRRLEHEIARRAILAPVAGRVGEALDLRPGAVVREAERLGAVVPEGEARVVGRFPAAAAGRIRAGQPARVRLEGFPWAQYGTLPATVAEVGTEPSEGLFRVEFTLAPGEASRVPREHGLPGTVEVAVEEVAPAVLVLRAAGHLLYGEPPAAADPVARARR
jgi:membrane fusion protein (multidrug efflux system)